MKAAVEQYDVGVIVGRFQVHELHEAHRNFISHVCDEHSKVIIFLGLSPLMNTRSNPLDFEARKQMILEAFPNVTVLYIQDVPDDKVWSKRLDSQVRQNLTPVQSAVLYGGRDGFLDHYDGTFPTRELISDVVRSGTAVRREIAAGSTKSNPDFRAGVVWASTARFPAAYCTVDVAVTSGRRLLLGRKEHESKFRFIGGFSDPGSPSLEADCRREVQEEAGISITDPRYIASAIVDDWRYRTESDCIKTTLWIAELQFGSPAPGDDIDEVRWFDIDAIEEKDLVPTHRPLLGMLLAYLGR